MGYLGPSPIPMYERIQDACCNTCICCDLWTLFFLRGVHLRRMLMISGCCNTCICCDLMEESAFPSYSYILATFCLKPLVLLTSPRDLTQACHMALPLFDAVRVVRFHPDRSHVIKLLELKPRGKVSNVRLGRNTFVPTCNVQADV